MPTHIIYYIRLIEEQVTMNDGNLMQSRAETTLGRYLLRNKIGSGGMGDVWLADDPRLRRQVAIKTLPTHNQNDREYLQRFVREARAAATLNHPHILLVHDYGEQTLPNGQSITFIVMPFVAGGTLADQITHYTNRGQLMPLNETLSYLSQAADAIDYAHAQGIIHRDIKPRNMLLREDRWLLLTDFGIARILSDQEQLTQTGVGFGTPEYMAPEQAQGHAIPASDIYSLAVIAYQLLTGRLPFTADTAYAITVQHIVSPPPSPRQFNSAIPPSMEQAILQGLAKDPAQRPPSAQAFVAALQAASANMSMPTMVGSTGATFIPTVTPTTPFIPTRVEPTEPQTEQTGTPASKGMSRRALLISGGAALVLLGGLGTWEIASHLGQPRSKQPQHTPTPITRQTTTPAPGPNGPALTLTGHTQPVIALTWSPLATALISGGLDSYVKLWDIQGIQQGTYSTTKPKVNLGNMGNQTILFGWSPDASTLAIGNYLVGTTDQSYSYVALYRGDLSGKAPGYANPIAFPSGPTMTAMTWAAGKYLTVPITSAMPNQPGVFAVQFALAASTLDSRVVTAAPIPITVVGNNTSIETNTLAYSPDGSKLAAGTIVGVAIISLTLTGTTPDVRLLSTLQMDNLGDEADAVTWSPDGQRLAALCISPNTELNAPSILDVWNIASGAKTPTALNLPKSATKLQTLAWSPAPKSTLLASGSGEDDGNVYLWDIATGNSPTRTLNGPHAPVTALAWSHNGQWIAAAYSDDQNSILLWKV